MATIDPTKLLKLNAEQLARHFDSVLIVTTQYNAETGETYNEFVQRGNHYASIGAVEWWLEDTRGDWERDDPTDNDSDITSDEADN